MAWYYIIWCRKCLIPSHSFLPSNTYSNFYTLIASAWRTSWNIFGLLRHSVIDDSRSMVLIVVAWLSNSRNLFDYLSAVDFFVRNNEQLPTRNYFLSKIKVAGLPQSSLRLTDQRSGRASAEKKIWFLWFW